MSRRLPLAVALAALAVLFSALEVTAQIGHAAQVRPGQPAPRAGWTEADEQARVRAELGDLGLPAWTPLSRDEPRNTLATAARAHVGQSSGTQAASPGDAASQQTFTIPASTTGTGVGEIIWYQLPAGHVPGGDPRPLLVAWHGYGSSAFSVATQSTLDEECDVRGWLYLSVTGLDDKLFGSLPAQAHASAAIRWMQENFEVDAERIYMVGFSMGAGAVASYAARHRDPAEPMIAALGLVAPSFDWTQSWSLAVAPVKTIMQHPMNFGAPPATVPFEYRRVSTIFFDPATYPLAPGVALPQQSMGRNLASTPIWMTWDTGDTLPENPPAMGAALAGLLDSLGGTVTTHTVSGTVNPDNGQPAPHSWAVLNETLLCDWLSDQVLVAMPASFHAQVDQPATVAYLELLPRDAESFAYVHASADENPAQLELVGLDNLEALALDAADAGLARTTSLRLIAHSDDVADSTLRLAGFEAPPSYLVETAGGALITGSVSDPLGDALEVELRGQSTLDAQMIIEPWLGKLRTAPEPIAPGGLLTLLIDMPSGAGQFGWLILSYGELLQTLKQDYHVTASVAPPALLIGLALDTQGDLALAAALPNDPALSGLRVPMQMIATDASINVLSISNLWAMNID